MDKKIIITTLQDWVDSNPSIKKKFMIEDIFLLPNKLIEIRTSSPTKTNQLLLKKYIKNILKYFSIEVENVIFSHELVGLNFDGLIEKYVNETGLQKGDYKIEKKNLSVDFISYEIILNISILKLLNLKNFHIKQEDFYTYGLIDKKFKNLFSINFKFTDKFINSLKNFNDEFISYMQTSTHTFKGVEYEVPEWVKNMKPSIGFFKSGPNTLTVFHDKDNHLFSEPILNRALKKYFNYFGLKMLSDWQSQEPKFHTYVRGPWVKMDTVAYGFVEPNSFFISPELRY